MDLQEAEEMKQFADIVSKKDEKCDLRYIKTEAGIQNAFLHLLQTKKFNDITVQNIIDYALINRKTFYNHYLDKYDLLDKMIDAAFEELQGLLNGRTRKVLYSDSFFFQADTFYQNLFENRERYLTLWDLHINSPSINNRLFQFFREEYLKLANRDLSEKSLNFQATLFASMQSGLLRVVFESSEPFSYEKMKAELRNFYQTMEKYTRLINQ